MTLSLHQFRGELNVRNSAIHNALFDDVNLSGVRFHNVNLSAANVGNVNLSDVRFENVNMSNVVIENANITGMKINGVAVDELFAAYTAAQNV